MSDPTTTKKHAIMDLRLFVAPKRLTITVGAFFSWATT
jgi:hypothetical protein